MAAVVLAALLSLLLAACGGGDKDDGGSTSETPTTSAVAKTADVTEIPLGDGKISTSGPKKGYVYRCSSGTRNAGGAEHGGPWIHGDTWNLDQKISVPGSVSWPEATVSFDTSQGKRDVSGNGLPVDTKTGTFPIPTDSEAYEYDTNPNSIEEQPISYELPAEPEEASEPSCVSGGAIGIMTNGVAIYDAVDAAGRDAVAREVQDRCSGHPQGRSQYHYHGIFPCQTTTKSGTSHSELIGYALDGFGLYGPRGEDGQIVANEDLDGCHGHTHEVEFGGEEQTIFHYHSTFEYPYSIGCYRGTPVVDQSAQGPDGGQGGGPGG